MSKADEADYTKLYYQLQAQPRVCASGVRLTQMEADLMDRLAEEFGCHRSEVLRIGLYTLIDAKLGMKIWDV